MPSFKYEAIDADGQTSTGTLAAENQAEATSALAGKGLTPTSVAQERGGGEKKKPSAASKPSSAVAEKIKELDVDLPSDLSKVKVKQDELLIFTRQLATMVDAGLPIDQALETLAEQTKSDVFRIVLFIMLNEIRSGTRISQAIEKYPRLFPDIYVSMVRAAEASGQLGVILDQLAGYMEASARVKQKVKSAMTYPVLATGMIVVVAGILILVAVPKFAKMFDMVKGDLPLPTKLVLGLSNFLRQHSLVAILIFVSLVAGLIIMKKTERGAYLLDLFKLKVPVFGKLFSQVAVARFSRTLSTLLSSGVPILDALDIVERASGNRVVADAVHHSIAGVSGGATLAEVFATRDVFPPMLIKMISVGEMTGQLDSLLERIARFYDERVTSAVEGLTSMIEPLLIGVLGLVVGGIVVAIFFPMIKITQSI
jgi:type IV pilus assembly protein PilC